MQSILLDIPASRQPEHLHAILETGDHTLQEHLITFQESSIVKLIPHLLVEKHITLTKQFLPQLCDLTLHAPRFGILHAVTHQLGNPRP